MDEKKKKNAQFFGNVSTVLVDRTRPERWPGLRQPDKLSTDRFLDSFFFYFFALPSQNTNTESHRLRYCNVTFPRRRLLAKPVRDSRQTAGPRLATSRHSVYKSAVYRRPGPVRCLRSPGVRTRYDCV